MPDPQTPDEIVVAGFSAFAGYIPSVVIAALAVALLIWGTKRLVGLFKSLAR